MIYYQVHLDNPHIRIINKAVEILEQGGLIVYPTDTVYGIGCSIYQKNAIERLYRLKHKSKFEAVSLICDSIQQAARYTHISNFTFRILKRCFPGPFTIVLETTREIPRLMLSRRKEIGVRIPDNEVCRALVNGLGHPLVNTSADLKESETGELILDLENYQNDINMFLDAGSLPEARESTVVRLINNEVEILREGKGDVQKLLT